MKKVLFTATVDSHIKQFHLPYLELFKKKGYEVHVATNGKDEIPYCDVKHQISFERNPIKINNLKAIKNLKKIIEREKFDIIHCHTPMGSVVTRLAAMKSRKKYKTRVLYTAHGFHFFKGASLINWIVYYPIELILSNITDCLITINEEDYNLAKKRFKAKQIELVHGVGVDKNRFDFEMPEEEMEKLRKSLGLKKKDFVIIYVAELNKNKNQIMAIKAIEELIKEYKNIKLLLVGKDSYNNTYQNMVKDLKLEHNVIFTGYRRDVNKLMKISNLAISTSKREGLPVNLIEATVSGLPIIATNCRGNRDVVKYSGNGKVVEIGEYDNLVRKIEEIYRQKNNSEINYKKFILKNIIEVMEKIYFNKKKIVHLLASNTFSGAENVVCTIIENLKDSYDMIYCSPDGKIKEYLQSRNIKFQPINKISVSSIRKIKKYIKKLNADVIHAHDFKASIIACFVNNNARIISHLHKNDLDMKKISIKSVLYTIFSNKFTNIIGVSDSIINEYLFKKKIKDKYITLYNVIDKNEIIKNAEKIDIDKKYDLFYIGRFNIEKNPMEFIEIIKELKKKNKNIKSIMIGDGKLFDACKYKINEYNLENNIEMIGFKENPFPYVKASKIGIMPSKYEGFGLAAIECSVLGKPILNSGVGGLKEVFVNNKEFICKTQKEYIEKIDNLLNNSDVKINIDEKYYDLEEYREKIKQLYN